MMASWFRQGSYSKIEMLLLASFVNGRFAPMQKQNKARPHKDSDFCPVSDPTA